MGPDLSARAMFREESEKCNGCDIQKKREKYNGIIIRNVL